MIVPKNTHTKLVFSGNVEVDLQGLHLLELLRCQEDDLGLQSLHHLIEEGHRKP